MKRSMIVLVKILPTLLLAAMLSGCFGVHSKAAPTSPRLSMPTVFQVDEAYTHEESGVVFPDDLDGIKLIEVVQYDEEAYEIGVLYRGPEPSPILSVYLYPGPPMSHYGGEKSLVESMDLESLEVHFEQVSDEVAKAHPAFVMVSEQMLDSDHAIGKERSWEYLVQTPYGEIPFVTTARLYLIDHKWYYKIRATAPKMLESQTDEAVKALAEILLSEEE